MTIFFYQFLNLSKKRNAIYCLPVNSTKSTIFVVICIQYVVTLILVKFLVTFQRRKTLLGSKVQFTTFAKDYNIF